MDKEKNRLLTGSLLPAHQLGSGLLVALHLGTAFGVLRLLLSAGVTWVSIHSIISASRTRRFW